MSKLSKSEELKEKLSSSFSVAKEKKRQSDNTANQVLPSKSTNGKSGLNHNRKNHSAKTHPESKSSPSIERITASIHQKDVKKTQEILIYMLQNGQRVTMSDIVKMALRSVKIDDSLLHIYDEIKKDDSRRK